MYVYVDDDFRSWNVISEKKDIHFQIMNEENDQSPSIELSETGRNQQNQRWEEDHHQSNQTQKFQLCERRNDIESNTVGNAENVEEVISSAGIQSFDSTNTTNLYINKEMESAIQLHNFSKELVQGIDDSENDLETGGCNSLDLTTGRLIKARRHNIDSLHARQTDQLRDDSAIIVTDTDDKPSQSCLNSDFVQENVERIASAPVISSLQHCETVSDNLTNMNDNQTTNGKLSRDIQHADDGEPHTKIHANDTNNFDNDEDDHEKVVYGRNAAKIKCPHCEQYVFTFVHHRISWVTILCCILIIIIPIMWPIFWLPFCLPICQTTKHVCPNCQKVVCTIRGCQCRGSYKRDR